MQDTISRRSFTRLIPAIPVAAAGMRIAALYPSLQQRVSPRRLAAQDEELADRFLARHEATMVPLRAIDLPNSLPPYYVTHAAPMGPDGEESDA